MSNNTGLPALIICDECQMHGRILLTDGRASPEFAFDAHGVKILNAALLSKFIDGDEFARLESEIEASTLPSHHSLVEDKLLWNLNVYNVLHESDMEIGINIHEFLHDEPKDVDIPEDFRIFIDRAFSPE
jgi:hypothetical protein